MMCNSNSQIPKFSPLSFDAHVAGKWISLKCVTLQKNFVQQRNSWFCFEPFYISSVNTIVPTVQTTQIVGYLPIDWDSKCECWDQPSSLRTGDSLKEPIHSSGLSGCCILAVDSVSIV